MKDKQTNKQTNKKTQKNLVFSQLTDTQAGGNLTISHNFLKIKKYSKRRRTIENNTAIREMYIKLPSRHSDTKGDIIKLKKSQTSDSGRGGVCKGGRRHFTG